MYNKLLLTCPENMEQNECGYNMIRKQAVSPGPFVSRVARGLTSFKYHKFRLFGLVGSVSPQIHEKGGC